VLQAFPQAPGQQGPISGTAPSAKTSNVYGAMKREGEASADSDNQGAVGFKMKPGARRIDTGSAARFFYCAKASKSDRGEGNNHPTVKPADLMRYLIRLITPDGGTVLDPFMGSGSTLKAAELEGFDAIGIELSPDYIDIARRRIGADAPLFMEPA
jgi:site-specific DNA-methyltransferase (adenine-specific)